MPLRPKNKLLDQLITGGKLDLPVDGDAPPSHLATHIGPKNLGKQKDTKKEAKNLGLLDLKSVIIGAN